jgi:glutamate-1-semialdehyde 2,1-aminomutase
MMVRSRQSLEAEYSRVTPRSRAQWERGKPVMPGGIIKGAYWNSPHPLYIERANGCYVWDLDGQRYVDFANHHSAMVLGHSHPAVVQAVQRELDRGIGPGGPTTLEAEIAEEICKRVPSVEKVRFTNSGTEASLHITRLVRAVTGRPKVAKFEGAYHGSHDALELSVYPPLDRAGPADSPSAVAAWNGMARGSEEDVVMLPYDQRESVELILRENRDELAAVFYDGKPGIYDTPVDFTHFVRDITQELGLLLVMDEVVSFRAGHSGYQGACGVEPDLTMFGKLFGGGFPVGVIGGRADLMDELDNTHGPTMVSQSGTFSGNNFTLAAGLATLRELTPEVCQHLEALGDRLKDGLVDVLSRAGMPCQVVGQGSIVNFYITDEPVRDFRGAASCDTDLAARINFALMLKGYYVHGGLGLTISDPMGPEHVDGLVEALGQVLEERD